MERLHNPSEHLAGFLSAGRKTKYGRKEFRIETKRTYTKVMRQFFGWLKDAPLTYQNMLDYRDYLISRSLAAATINTHILTLQSFRSYLKDAAICELFGPDLLQVVADDSKTTTAMVEDAKRLLRAARNSRDKAIVLVLYSTGIRVGELARLKRDDVRWDARQIYIRGKGGKTRVVDTTEQTISQLQTYLARRLDKESCLFYAGRGVGRQDHSMSERSIERLIARLCKKARIEKRITPHSLRRGFATALADQGMSLPQIQDYTGHASVDTLRNHYIKRAERSEARPDYDKYRPAL